MLQRPFWIERMKSAWTKKSLLWLSGARRAGKTTLARMLDNTVYMNCDLPSVSRKLEDPESFYESLDPGNILIFDEVHRLEDPSRVLKIGTDEFPVIKILATGSSTLEATRKFKDSLTGRKISIYLPPVIWDECKEVFGIKDLEKRILMGGLPEPLLTGSKDPSFFSEWFDSFYARDIQEIFNIRNRTGYLKLMKLLYRSSGNIMEYSQLSRDSGLSRPTVMTYIESLRIAQNIYLLAPFHGRGKREITARPKIYAFDTGFVTFINNWNELRNEEIGILWEHLVLDLIRSYFPDNQVYYWRDNANHEIDFVIMQHNGMADIIECKVNPDHLSTKSIRLFRELYPKGKNICCCPYIKEPYTIRKNDLKIHFTGTLRTL